MSLPTDYDARKALPVFTYLTEYFPDAFLACVDVAVKGNAQHKNPTDKIRWDRSKSTDQLNTALRHQIDHGTGSTKDTDGCYHLAKAIWRLSAELQLVIERERDEASRSALTKTVWFGQPAQPCAPQVFWDGKRAEWIE